LKIESEKLNQQELLDIVRKVIELVCLVTYFPEYVSFSKDDIGRTIFSVKLVNPLLGDMSFQYILPELRLIEYLKTYIQICSVLPQEQISAASQAFLKREIRVFLTSFLLETVENFRNMWDISDLFVEKTSLIIRKDNLTRGEQTALVNEFARNRKLLAKKLFENFLSERNKEEFHWNSLQNIIAHFYDFLLPKWQAAKALYKQNKQAVLWKQYIYMWGLQRNVHFPAELLEKLADLDNYESEPSYIAAQHAAKICRMPTSGRFSIKDSSGFERRIARSRKWMKANPVQVEELFYFMAVRTFTMRVEPVFKSFFRDLGNLSFSMSLPEDISHLDIFLCLTERKLEIIDTKNGMKVRFNREDST
jgi:hypothetical protein